ncbi:uncharacterized protein BROUX77_005452 [Berkeleyomyces rouxiae]|uniref:uncharacterized protein n=1 Tax=Berkeleyomyces rouxiae TaxID=2035830 RepID=UPI003B7B9D0A
MAPSFSSLLATGLIASQVALALPTSPTESSADAFSSAPGTWSAKQARDVGYSLDGIASLAEIYSKYGVLMPQDLQDALNRNQKRGVISTPSLPVGTCGSKFALATKIGLIEPKIYNLVVDTAFHGLWVHSPETANPKALQASYTYNVFSMGFPLKEYHWETKDPNGNTASGFGYTERVSISGLTIKEQLIQVAETVPSGFHDLPSVSGVIGMGIPNSDSMSFYPDYGIVRNARHQLDKQLFTVDMKHCSTGEVEFGYFDENTFGDLVGYSEVDSSQGYWNFTSHILGGVDVDDDDFDESLINDERLEYVVADTASDLLMLPLKYVEEYYGKVENAKYNKEHAGYVFPCVSQLPDFIFLSDGSSVGIPGRYLKLNQVDEEADFCFGALQPSDELGVNVFGSPAFKSALVVFDLHSYQIGWGSKDLVDEEYGWAN